MQKYRLMHRDVVCGNIIFDEENGNILSYRDFATGHSPFLGNADEKRIKTWWKARAVPASRSIIQNLLKQPGNLTAEQYLEKNLALSITDSYWVCPVEMDIKYEDVKFSNLSLFNDGKIPYHNATSYDPNASLGGQMEKYWDLSESVPLLVKESYKYYGQQAVNETFATRIHELLGAGISFTSYSMSRLEDGGLICKCKAFTSDMAELIPAYEVIESSVQGNDVSTYSHYISISDKKGIPVNIMQDFLDYQTATDFIISNTDEHLMNFGVLRNPNTLELIGPAPIFDSGNSMFYSEGLKCKHTRVELLDREVTSVYKTEEKLLTQIKNKKIIDIDKLPDKDYVLNFYTSAGIPEEKASNIAHNYSLKVEMFRDFQNGIKISLFNEKKALRQSEK